METSAPVLCEALAAGRPPRGRAPASGMRANSINNNPIK